MIKLGDDETDICEVGRWVRQGRLLSPLVFSISVENILIEAMDGSKEEVIIGGQLVRDVRFPDDHAMIERIDWKIHQNNKSDWSSLIIIGLSKLINSGT